MKLLTLAVVFLIAPLAVAQQSSWSATAHRAGVPKVTPVHIKVDAQSLAQPVAPAATVKIAVRPVSLAPVAPVAAAPVSVVVIVEGRR